MSVVHCILSGFVRENDIHASVLFCSLIFYSSRSLDTHKKKKIREQNGLDEIIPVNGTKFCEVYDNIENQYGFEKYEDEKNIPNLNKSIEVCIHPVTLLIKKEKAGS